MDNNIEWQITLESNKMIFVKTHTKDWDKARDILNKEIAEKDYKYSQIMAIEDMS